MVIALYRGMKVSLNITPEFSPAQVMSPDKQINGQTTPPQADSRFSLFIETKNTVPVDYEPGRVDKSVVTEKPSENGLKAGQCLYDGHSINNGNIISQDCHSETQEEPDQHIETGSNEELLSTEKEQAGNRLNLLNINPIIKDEIEIKGENTEEGREKHSEHGLKIGDVLYGLMKNYSGELQPDAYVDHAAIEAGDAVEAESLQANTGLPSESGLETGSLINNLASNHTEGIEGKLQEEAFPDEGINPEDISIGNAADKAAPAVDGIEASPGIIPAVEGEVEEPSSGIPAEKTAPSVGGTEVSRGIITAVEGEVEEPGSGVPAERGLKAGSPLNQGVDDNTGEKDAHDEGEIDSVKSANEKSLSTIDKGSEASETEHVEAEGKAHGRKAVSEAVLNQIKNVQADDNGDFQDIHDDIDIAKITGAKISSETSENDIDNVMRNFTSGNVKPVQAAGEGAEAGNGSLMNNSHMSSEGGRHSDSFFSQNSARPAGFNELLDNIVYVARGNNKLGVTLEHELLGRLNINLSLNKGVVNVHINTADNAVREFIENNIQSLVNALAEEDVSVGAFSVGLKGRKNHEGNAFTMNIDKAGEFLQETAGSVNDRGLINIFV
jgi:hypothetical protein